MASNTSASLHYGSDPTIGNTTFVQANPSNFREVVQKLTGAAPSDLLESSSASSQKLFPLRNLPPPPSSSTHKKQHNFKQLHERRHAAKKLQELNIAGVVSSQRPFFFFFNNNNNGSSSSMSMTPSPSPSPSPSPISQPPPPCCWYVGKRGGEIVMASPVSPLEVAACGSPKTRQEEEEQRIIAEKGFYLHPTTPKGSHHSPPQLLSLFPLHSPHSSLNQIN